MWNNALHLMHHLSHVDICNKYITNYLDQGEDSIYLYFLLPSMLNGPLRFDHLMFLSIRV